MKKFMYFAAALLVLVGCQKKENVIENTPQNLVTITGGIDFSAQDGPNKVAAKEGWENVTSGNQVEFVWEEGDKIAVTDFTEVKQFTVTSISEDKQTATFTGEPLSGGMEFYFVFYPYEYGEAMVNDQDRSFFASQPYSEKLRPYIMGSSEQDGTFTMNIFSSVMDLSLTGSDKLGKMVYHIDEDENDQPYDVTLSFGDGLQLTNQVQHVTFTPYFSDPNGFKLSFYDTNNQLIMEKKSKKSIDNVDKIFSFPTLEVKAVPQEVSWTKSLSLGQFGTTTIVIETGVVDVSSYTEDDTHKKLDDDGLLWEYLDGTTLHIQTPASKINSSLEGMFNGFASVVSISGLQYIHATTAQGMFNDCMALQSLDLSGFNTEDITDMSYMFSNCVVLQSLKLSDNFNVAQSKAGMFNSCGMFLPGGCTVKGVTDSSIKTALSADDTNWGDGYMRFDGE